MSKDITNIVQCNNSMSCPSNECYHTDPHDECNMMEGMYCEVVKRDVKCVIVSYKPKGKDINLDGPKKKRGRPPGKVKNKNTEKDSKVDKKPDKEGLLLGENVENITPVAAVSQTLSESVAALMWDHSRPDRTIQEARDAALKVIEIIQG